MKKYRSIRAMAEALKTGEIPSAVYSPGYVARHLGISRQALHKRLKCGTIEAWSAEGYVLVSEKSMKEALKKKRGIPDEQGELDVTT